MKTQWPLAVSYDKISNTLCLIDQNQLPEKLVLKHVATIQEVHDAIQQLVVRGAPAIGLAAAYGIAVFAQSCNADDRADFDAQIHEACDILAASRPTAVNLFYALDCMRQLLATHPTWDVCAARAAILIEAQRQQEEDAAICAAIGRYGAALLPQQATVMTYCNAGALATGNAFGTALAPIYVAHDQGHEVSVFACETRPVLQGARLTSYELSARGIPVTVLCDNMAAVIMRDRKPDAIFVGCDRVAFNGDTANKIGTYALAVLANAHDIPFYVCAPTTTIDRTLHTGSDIPIELRNAEEVRSKWYARPMVAEQADVFNPAFDVTPHALITAIITEDGIHRAPYHF